MLFNVKKYKYEVCKGAAILPGGRRGTAEVAIPVFLCCPLRKTYRFPVCIFAGHWMQDS